ncbi:hypothetical protein TDB9533_02754 [Thalassocella blandensis]|nr:hypothetical protein TDB9533_02754 [Thalassocella blandensis]
MKSSISDKRCLKTVSAIYQCLTKKMSFVAIASLIAFTLASNSWSDIVKWVDENGDVHYGDRVPEEYKDKAEILEKDDVQVVGQDDDIRLRNKQYSNSLRQQDYDSQKRKASQRYSSGGSSSSSTSTGVSQEDCRDRFPNNVKMRTQCFLDAAGAREDSEKE